MDLVTIFFALFSIGAVVSAFLVVATRHPVHAVLFLILTFVNVSGLFVLLGAEFLAMILLVVYVGAVAVLFLFVVMMLDVDFKKLKEGVLNYLPVGALIGALVVVQLIYVFGGWGVEVNQNANAENISNTKAIGLVLYTDYIDLFQLSGLILLVGMIGAIILTLRHKTNVKRQSIPKQVSRGKEGVEVVKVPFGKGLDEQ